MFDVSSDIYDKLATQRVYPTPAYNQDGDLVCRACGGAMARSLTGKGAGEAVCSNTGCSAHGFTFLEGSYSHSPSR